MKTQEDYTATERIVVKKDWKTTLLLLPDCATEVKYVEHKKMFWVRLYATQCWVQLQQAIAGAEHERTPSSILHDPAPNGRLLENLHSYASVVTLRHCIQP